MSHRHALVAALLLLACLPWRATAEGEAPPVRLRIVGGLAGLHQYTANEEPFWTREVQRVSGGRITAEIVPFDQAGIRGEEMLRLMKTGSVPFGTLLVLRMQATEPELAAADLPGMNPDMASLRRNLGAFRPRLERILRERHGIEALAVYTYNSQVTFCNRAFSGLADLAGRRVRTASAPQADLLRALGALPVTIEFAQVKSAMRSGVVDCAITGSMAGHTIGLDEVSTHIDARAVSWGLSVFGANSAAWAALPAPHQALLRRELAKLEAAIWAQSARESEEGVACVTGGATCTQPRKGKLTLVTDATADRPLREAFAAAVLPAWAQRCGEPCVAMWNEVLAPLVGVQARAR